MPHLPHLKKKEESTVASQNTWKLCLGPTVASESSKWLPKDGELELNQAQQTVDGPLVGWLVSTAAAC